MIQFDGCICFKWVGEPTTKLDLNTSWTIGPQGPWILSCPWFCITFRAWKWCWFTRKPWHRTNEELWDIKFHCSFGKCLFLVQKSSCQLAIVSSFSGLMYSSKIKVAWLAAANSWIMIWNALDTFALSCCPNGWIPTLPTTKTTCSIVNGSCFLEVRVFTADDNWAWG